MMYRTNSIDGQADQCLAGHAVRDIAIVSMIFTLLYYLVPVIKDGGSCTLELVLFILLMTRELVLVDLCFEIQRWTAGFH